MRVEPNEAAALRALLLQDLQAIARLEEHALSLLQTEPDRARVESLGFTLHNIFNALESSFVQISLTFENHVKDRSRWHREVLEKMFLPIPPLRPAVLPGAVRSLLADLLAFRHVFRHSYELTLDETRTLTLFDRWRRESSGVSEAIETFREQLAAAGPGTAGA